MATFRSPFRRTITTSWSLATRSSTEARLWRRLVYVVSVIFTQCTEFLYVFQCGIYNLSVSPLSNRLDRVLAQLRLYEHPLLTFDARAKGEGVEVIIRFKDDSVPVHTYYFDLHPRDLDHPQFEWTFQRQLYDALHDYFVEMFIRTPQDRKDRQQKGL